MNPNPGTPSIVRRGDEKIDAVHVNGNRAETAHCINDIASSRSRHCFPYFFDWIEDPCCGLAMYDRYVRDVLANRKVRRGDFPVLRNLHHLNRDSVDASDIFNTPSVRAID